MPLARTENLAKRSIGRLHDAADDIVDDVRTEARGRIRKATGAARAAYGQTRHRAEDMVDDARDYLRDRSLLTLGVGVAIGVLVSFLLHGEAKSDRPTPAAKSGHA